MHISRDVHFICIGFSLTNYPQNLQHCQYGISTAEYESFLPGSYLGL